MIEWIKRMAARLGFVELEEPELWWVVFRNKDDEVIWLYSVGYGNRDLAEKRAEESRGEMGLVEGDAVRSVEPMTLANVLKWMEKSEGWTTDELS